MTVLQIIISAAHTAKDIPTDETPVTKTAFNALNPRFTCDNYLAFVNKGYRWLLEQLPVSIIKQLTLWAGNTDTDSFVNLPTDMVRPHRVTLNVSGDEGGTYTAIRMTEKRHSANDTMEGMGGTTKQPKYIVYSVTGNNARIKFSPNVDTKPATIEYVKMDTLAISSPDVPPTLDSHYHELIARCGAREKMAVDNVESDKTYQVLKQEIDDEVARLKATYPED